MSDTPLLLVEILAEEIPAWMLDERVEVLRSRLGELFSEYEDGTFELDRIHCDATSRRIWFAVAGLGSKQPDRDEEIKGPPETVAYKDGEPTKALDGFLRKNAARSEDVERREGYLWLRRKVEGLSLEEFLAARLPALVEGIRWPKMMRWGAGEVSFIRPIHSIVVLYGERTIDLEIFGIRSSNRSAGHRTRGKASVAIESAETWEKTLRGERVVARVKERVSALQENARRLAAEVGGVPAEDPSIWNQWAYLTEFPGVVRSEFDETYLKLPEEVLVTVMRVHQKQLPVQEEGHLTRHFLSIVDMDGDPEGFASSGNAFVTNARFADALFFLEVDLKRDLAERIDDLSHLQFQEELGDYAKKTDRILEIATKLHSEVSSAVPTEMIEEACKLSKVDLQTEMVKEFTDLQGQIGGIYAARQGRSEEVWKAIYDQYRPQSLDDSLPETESGAILSLADRADTLAGFFLLGLEPTGSRDPFALRRAAQGLVRILFNDQRWAVPVAVDRIIEIALDAYPAGIGGDRAEVRPKLVDFVSERVRNVLETSWGYAYDEIAAAMSSGWTESLSDLRRRTDALHEARGLPEFLSILDSARRIANITPDGFEGVVQENLIEEDAEKRLFEIGRAVRSQIAELIEEKSYDRALQSFAAMAGELESFFDEVLVNVDDPKIRENRLSILQVVGEAVEKIGDVTRIVVDRKALDAARQ